MKYHKIQSLYLRDPETKFKTFLDEYARPEFGLLHDKPWYVEEKIDGTNIRVYYYPEAGLVEFGGRTDNAQIPAALVNHLRAVFPVDRFREVFDDARVCLYGEGFGRKIQKGGGNYDPDGVRFALFDVTVGSTWLERANVDDVAAKFAIDRAPSLGLMTLGEAEALVREGFASRIAKVHGTQAEGVVMRPLVDLFNRRGERVIAKLKTRDFAGVSR